MTTSRGVTDYYVLHEKPVIIDLSFHFNFTESYSGGETPFYLKSRQFMLWKQIRSLKINKQVILND